MLLRSPSVSLLECSIPGTSRVTAQISCSRRPLSSQPKDTGSPPHRVVERLARPFSAGRPHNLAQLKWLLDPHPRAQHDRPKSTGSVKRPEAVFKGQKKLLTPYELSLRVKASCDRGQLQEAVSTVKEAPRDAQNTIVWNNLIREIIQAGKYKQAYQLFTDMKRRGISPNTRTFSTLLGGYARIENWDEFPLQLQNVYNLYDQLRRYHSQVTSSVANSPELTHIPYTQLVQIFGQAQQFQRMFDVFNAMPPEGPLAAHTHTFTALLNAIASRKLSALASDLQAEGEAAEPSYNELQSKNASDAKLIWQQLLRASSKNPSISVDSFVLRALLRILARGRPSDQTFAFEVITNYLGLTRPGQTPLPVKVELHPMTLEAILFLCNHSHRYTMTLHYAQQVIDSDSGEGPGEHRLGLRRILTTRHMDLVLEAHAALAGLGAADEAEQALETLEWMLRMQAVEPAPGLDGGIGPQIRPARSTYDRVLLACWRGANWKGACRTFELMTGYESAQFHGEMDKPPTQQRRSPGRTIQPSAGFMSSMIRTAIKSRQTENIRQTLNIFNYYGWDVFFKWDPATYGATRKQEKDWEFYCSKLEEALSDGLSILLNKPEFDPESKAQWNELLTRTVESARSMPKVPKDADAGEVDGRSSPRPGDQEVASYKDDRTRNRTSDI